LCGLDPRKKLTRVAAKYVWAGPMNNAKKIKNEVCVD